MEQRDKLMLTAGFWKLDADQTDAFNADGNTLVVAGPGSGKTRLLVAKAVRLALQKGSKNICLVTFSKNAVTEIQHKLAAALGPDRARSIKVGTFHSFTYRMLRASWEESRVTPPTLMNDFAAKDLMMRCLTQLSSECDMEEVLQALSIAKASPISAGEPNLTNSDPQISRLLNLYEHKRKAMGAIDFSDMVREAAFGLRSGTVAPLPYQHYLVDEYQDIDPAQKDWLDYHLSNGAQATAVGDDDQAIYGFRASMGFTAMTLFCDQFKARRLNLSTNYRCAQDIIAASRLVIEVSRDRFAKNIVGVTEARGSLVITSQPSDESLADLAVANFMYRFDEQPTITFAVISRTNNGLDAVEMACARAGAPCLRIGSASLLKKEAIARRAALLTAVVQPFDKASFVSAIHGLAFTNQGKSAIADFFANSLSKYNITETLFEASLYQTLARDDATLLRTTRDLMTAMTEDYADLNQETPTDDQIGQFVARSFDRCMQVQKEIPILAFLRSVLKTYRRGTLLERLQSLDKKEKTDESKREGVLTLITAHRSKGLEFDHVWIVGCSNGIFPSSEKGNIAPVLTVNGQPKSASKEIASQPINVFAEEERRLFYVSMSRAKESLTLSFSQENGQNLYLSQLVEAAAPPAHAESELVTS